MKLSRTQQELLDAMKSGVTISWCSRGGDKSCLIWRGDTLKPVAQAALALEHKKAIKRVYNSNHLNGMFVIASKE